MNLNVLTLTIMLAFATSCSMAAPPLNMDNSIKELYDYLLQREYPDPLSLDHQMERKAVRSPSLRLRFGRRSDPDVPLRQMNEIEDEIEQKSIRSPSMRLRFGRRNDPSMSLFNENMLAEEPLRRKAQRTPSVRLRFGKREDPSVLENELNSYHSTGSHDALANHPEDN